MSASSAATTEFQLDRSIDDVVSLKIKTRPGKMGEWGLFFAIAAGLYLTAILGSYDPNIRGDAGSALPLFLGFLVVAGLLCKALMIWAARKSSGTVIFSRSTRTLTHQGLEWIFRVREFVLPDNAVLLLDAITVVHRKSSRSVDRASTYVRLVCIPTESRTADETVALIEGHRQAMSARSFHSDADAPLPLGGTLLGVAFENPIFRRVAGMLEEWGGYTGYDATGARTETFARAVPQKTAMIGAPQRFVIPTVSLPIKIFAAVFATFVIGFISLISLNPYVGVYLVLLITMALSARQILICDDSGVRLHSSYFFGLWRRGADERRWDEITAIQTERASNGFLQLAIRRADGEDLKIILPNQRAGERLEQRLKQLISSGDANHLP